MDYCKYADVFSRKGDTDRHRGIGDMPFRYNHAVTIPFYGDVSNISRVHDVLAEDARPGYYAVTIGDIDCETTSSDKCVYHHCYFGKDGGRVALDFSNDGILREFGIRLCGSAKDTHLEITPFGEVLFSCVVSDVRLYFCASLEGVDTKASLFAGDAICDVTSKDDIDVSKPFGGVFDFSGNSVIVKIAYSTIDFDHAKADVRSSIDSFDTVMNRAYAQWNKQLSRIEIDTDDEGLKRRFYSNLYHYLIRSIDMAGGCTLASAVYPDMGSRRAYTDCRIVSYDPIDPCFVWNLLGLFPKEDSEDILISPPYVKGAVIHLSNGDTLRIVADNLSGKSCDATCVKFNDSIVTDRLITIEDIMRGGSLVFDIKKDAGVL